MVLCTIDLSEITKIFQEIALKNAKSIELVTINTWGSLAVCIGQWLRNFVKTYTLLLVDIFINTLMQKYLFFEKMSLRSNVHEAVKIRCIQRVWHNEFVLLHTRSSATTRTNQIFTVCFSNKQFFVFGLPTSFFSGGAVLSQFFSSCPTFFFPDNCPFAFSPFCWTPSLCFGTIATFCSSPKREMQNEVSKITGTSDSLFVGS